VPSFSRYIGIDYSGAETAESSLKAIRVYTATSSLEPAEERPRSSASKYWSRSALADWLVKQLSAAEPFLVGIDHAFSFPITYFEKYNLPPDWPAFLDEFQRNCPTDESIYVDFVREGVTGCWNKVTGNPAWLRLTEQWTTSAKSVFQFDIQGAVAKATYAGLPWLRYLRRELGNKIYFWPFDGWDVPEHKSVVAEVYPSLWMKRFPRQERDNDQHAAYSVSAWLRRADLNGSLPLFFNPHLNPQERKLAEIEGWILGVM